MVKRVGNLIARIADRENLREAFLRAARGKQGKRAVRNFRADLDSQLDAMRRQLLDGSYQFGHYRFFSIYDPKQRTICAASFPERVAFHAMMRICHPVFDDYQIADSYASRKGKGQYKALERAGQFCRRYRWFAKLDVCKYFDSISHEVLLHQLSRLFKDRQLMLYFRNLVDGYETAPGRGLPIGNLTSQYFANHYLALADHYVKETLRARGYIRYMDDMLLFSEDKAVLMEWVRALTACLQQELRLEMHQPVVNHVGRGVPFLGYVVYPAGLRLNIRSRRRFRQKMSMLHGDFLDGLITDVGYADHATCLQAFVDKAHAAGLKRRLSCHTGIYPLGL